MDILDFKKHLQSRRHDSDVIKSVRSHVLIKPKWTWRRVKEDGTVTEATRGNTTDPLLADYLGLSWMGASGVNSQLLFPGTIEIKNSSGGTMFTSALYDVASPIGGPYTALTAWPAGGEFLGQVPRNKSPGAAGAISKIILKAGTVAVSTTNPSNWSVGSGDLLVTMPGTKRLAELWEFHISVDIYMDGVKSVRMWDLLAGVLHNNTNKHFGIATGGSELQVSRVGTGGTVGNAQGVTSVAVADSIVRSVSNREITAKWTIDGSQLTGLSLGTALQKCSLKPTFGKSPAEVYYGNNTTVETDLTSSSVKELEVITTFGVSVTLNIGTIDDINIPDSANSGTSTVTVLNGNPPYRYFIIDHDRPGYIQVEITNDGGATATVTAHLDTQNRPTDGSYNVTVGVSDADGNTASQSFNINVGQEVEA